jgi:hypothetical protein
MTMHATRAVAIERTPRWTWPHSVGGWWAVGISVATLVAWLALPITGWWAMALVAGCVTLLAVCVNIGCLWRWDDSSLNLLAAASTALVALLLIVTLVGAIATIHLG